jgi:hypothetical protein
VYWALYGEQQGSGPYCDGYIIDNISRGIRNGWYSDLHSGWFPMIGFKLGMLHGGMIEPTTHQLRSHETLVVLSDPDFHNGYRVGREYYFVEAPLEGRHLSDRLFFEAVHEWASGYPIWREPEETLRYCLGCRIGELSGAVFPLRDYEQLSVEAVIHL